MAVAASNNYKHLFGDPREVRGKLRDRVSQLSEGSTGLGWSTSKMAHSYSTPVNADYVQEA